MNSGGTEMNKWLRWTLIIVMLPILITLCIARWLGYALASAVSGEWL
jgi:uncharacterized membrane protein